MHQENLDNLYKVVTFIEENLTAPISSLEVLVEFDNKGFDVQALFHELTGHEVNDYLLRRRLSEAAIEILEGKLTIEDISNKYHFSALDKFAEAFLWLFKTSPESFKEAGSVHMLQWKRRFSMDYIHHLNTHNYRQPDKVTIKELNIAGHVISDRHFYSSSGQHLNQDNAMTHYLHIHRDHRHLHEYAFMKGVGILGKKVEDLKEVKADWMCKPIKNVSCLKFEYTGSYFQIQNVYTYIFESWLPFSVYSNEVPYVFEEIGASGNKTNIYIPIIHSQFDDENSV